MLIIKDGNVIMRKICLVLVCLFICTNVSNAQIKLKKEDCVANVSPDGEGYCAWSCIETLGRHHKIKSLYGLKEKRTKESDFKTWDAKKKHWVIEPYVWVNYGTYWLKVHRSPGDYVAIKQKLDEAKVKYQIQESGIRKTDIISYAIRNKLGCMIVVNDWTEKSTTTHAMCIQDYDNEKVVLFDPNNLKYNYHVTWDWMTKYWTGYVLVIEGVKE